MKQTLSVMRNTGSVTVKDHRLLVSCGANAPMLHAIFNHSRHRGSSTGYEWAEMQWTKPAAYDRTDAYLRVYSCEMQ